MDFSVKKILTVYFLSMACITTCHACTNIVLKAKDNTVMIGRTLEFGPDLKSVLYLKSRGDTFINRTSTGDKTLSWRAKYGYIYANGFGMDLPLDGMNEKGLSIGYLYLPGYTTYPSLPKTLDAAHKALSVMNLPHYLLSQYDKVSDIKKALRSLIIYNERPSVAGQPSVKLDVHMVITDETGDTIVLEWLNGKTHIFNNKIGVLTNSPPFFWQHDNLKNYLGLSPYAPKPITINGIAYAANGQGSGWLGLPGDFSPPSRFVKMASMLAAVTTPKNAETALVLAQHVLANVFIPSGFIRAKQKNGQYGVDTTQWSVFKDLTHRKFYFNSYDYPMLQLIDLTKIDFSRSATHKTLALAHPNQQAVEVTNMIVN